MKIIMTQTKQGSDVDKDGCSKGPKTYFKDKVYEVGEELGKAFCDHLDAAKPFKGEISDAPPEEKSPEEDSFKKDLGPAPENKKLNPEGENKVGSKKRRRSN